MNSSSRCRAIDAAAVGPSISSSWKIDGRAVGGQAYVELDVVAAQRDRRLERASVFSAEWSSPAPPRCADTSAMCARRSCRAAAGPTPSTRSSCTPSVLRALRYALTAVTVLAS